MIPISRAAVVLAFILAASVQPVTAQVVDPQGCSDVEEQIRYLVNEGAFVQEAGLKNGVDSLAQARALQNAVCGTADNDASPIAVPTEPPSTILPSPTAVAAQVRPTPGDDDSATRRDACLLITEAEVGIAMKQDVVANEADPAGSPGQGCEFNGVAEAYTDVMYFQASGSIVYDELHATAEANGVQAIPGLGDRAFRYVGDSGPGVVVAKGDKVFTIEFNGIGDGPSERNSLLVLAQQAVGHVH